MSKVTNLSDKVLANTFLLFIPGFVTPNHLTIVRFLSLPFVVYLLLTKNFVLATIFFGLSALTDALDGALARTRNQVTEWGRTYDPIADKLLIGSSVLILITDNLNPLLGLAIFVTDIVTGLIAIYKAKVKGRVVNPHWTGKLKMVLQSVGIFFLLFSLIFAFMPGFIISEIVLLISLVLGIISLIIYESA